MSEQQQTKQGGCDAGSCACGGAGPAFTEFLRRLGPPPAAREHFQQAQVSFLKGIRALVDARIDAMNAEHRKGVKIDIE